MSIPPTDPSQGVPDGVEAPGGLDPAKGRKSLKDHKDLLAARLLGSLMSIVFVGLGAHIIWTEHAPERSTRFGMAEALEGRPAIQFGVTVILMGLGPLAFWFRTGKGAALWMSACLGGALLFAAFGSRMFA